MVNSRRKGNRAEVKAVKQLESQGFLVYRVKGSTRFNKCVDIFNLFDILAVKPMETLLLQVKTRDKPKLQPFEEFKKKYSQFNVQVWVWKDRKGFVIFEVG
jgi:Holliday junction resolvase